MQILEKADLDSLEKTRTYRRPSVLLVAVALEVGHGDGLDFRHRTSWRERWRILGVRFGVAMRNLREPGIDGRCDISRRLERANNGPGDNTAKLFYRDLGRHKVVVVNLRKLL